MGDILATEANLLGMIKEVNSNFKMHFKLSTFCTGQGHLSCLVFVLVP